MPLSFRGTQPHWGRINAHFDLPKMAIKISAVSVTHCRTELLELWSHLKVNACGAVCLQLRNAQGRLRIEHRWFMEIPSEKVVCALLRGELGSQVILEGMCMKFSDEDLEFYRLESHLIQTICWNVKLNPSHFSYISHLLRQFHVTNICWEPTGW